MDGSKSSDTVSKLPVHESKRMGEGKEGRERMEVVERKEEVSRLRPRL